MDQIALARSQFAVAQEHIYMDLANQCIPPQTVVQRLARFWDETYRHGPDKEAYFAEAEATRGKLAKLLHCGPDEIALTKNTSEGLNIAAAGIDFRPGDNVVLSQFEHPNNTYAWLGLSRIGVEVRVVRPPGAVLQAQDLVPAIDARTRAVACSAVSYMPGERIDLAMVGAACRKHGAYLVVDAVQGLGLIDVDPRELGIDMLAGSGHKGLLSPHGVGLFYCRRELCPRITPVFVARAGMRRSRPMEQDAREYFFEPLDDARRFEYGNLNYSGLAALGAALDLILAIGIQRIESHVTGLAGRMVGGLVGLGDRGVKVLTPVDSRSRASIVGFGVPGTEATAAALRAAGVVFTVRRDALRFGLGLYNTPEEIDRVLEVIEGVL